MSGTNPRIPKIRFGVVLVLVYFILMFLAAVQNPASFDTSPFFWMAVICLIASSVYFLMCVWGLHRALRAATGGAYPVGPVPAVVFHFVPFFIFYWVFRWTGEVARLVAAADPERKIALWKPGLVMLIGFAAGQTLDAGFSSLTNLLVVGWLARLVRPALENPEAISNYQQSGAVRKLDMKKNGIAIGACVVLAVFVTAINLAAMRAQLADQQAAESAATAEAPAETAEPAVED